jgi:hypothetical protein
MNVALFLCDSSCFTWTISLQREDPFITFQLMYEWTKVWSCWWRGPAFTGNMCASVITHSHFQGTQSNIYFVHIYVFIFHQMNRVRLPANSGARFLRTSGAGVNWDYICLRVLVCVIVRLHTLMFKVMACAREITQTHIIWVCNSYYYCVSLFVLVFIRVRLCMLRWYFCEL